MGFNFLFMIIAFVAACHGSYGTNDTISVMKIGLTRKSIVTTHARPGIDIFE